MGSSGRGGRPSSGVDTVGREQGPALCRGRGRGAGVLEDERGAAGRGQRSPVSETKRGSPFLEFRARRAVRLKRDYPSEPWSGSAGFPEMSQGAGALGRD